MNTTLHAFMLILLLGLAARCEPLVTRALYNQLRSMKNLTWEVVPLEDNVFKDWTVEDMKHMLGERAIDVTGLASNLPASCSPPDSFNGSAQFNSCIHAPMTQGECGACWAFSISEMLSDRLCIAGKDVVLSPQDLASCDKSNSGCDGGAIYYASLYAEDAGVVEEACFPYSAGSGPSPVCPRKCPTGRPWTKFHCKRGSTVVLATTSQMKCEIMNGPVSARFDVYADFSQYKSGVYTHQTGEYEGGHAIKVLGWGTENGTAYWMCENSWGPSWGMNGYFKIKQGECGIDNYMVSCTPA